MVSALGPAAKEWLVSTKSWVLGAITAAVLASDGAARAADGDGNSLAIEQQELEVAPERVRALYVLRNTSQAEQTITMTMPIETFVGDDDNDAQALVPWERATIYVNGAPRKVDLRARRDGNTLRVSYRWKQTIAAGGKITVEHEYDPGGQVMLPRGGEANAADWAQLTTDYCLDKATQRWGQAAQRKGQRVHYLLSGLAGSGNVAQFKLTLKKAKPTQRLSVCLPGLRKVDGLTMALERKLFTPPDALRILYLN